MPVFNPQQFRQYFPAASETCYLDSAATALTPQAVIDTLLTFYHQPGGNVHRSQHSAARQLTEHYEQVRAQVAAFIHAPASQNIVWTKGTTESINLVAQSYFRPRLAPGDELIVSEAEHHANLVPWLMLAEQTGATLVKWPIGDNQLPEINTLAGLINKKTRLVAIGQMSNVTGGIPDLAGAITLAHQVGAKVMVDGAQGIVHQPCNVTELDIDFYAFSAHKLYGPTGTGILYAKSALLEAMSPWQGGGKMLTEVNFTGFIPQPVPWRFEAGTPNVAGVLGFGAALKWLSDIDQQAAESWSCHLASLAETQLARLPGFTSYRCGTSALLAFSFEGVHHSDIATLLAEKNIALRAGQHCAHPLLKALGVGGVVRASFAPYNCVDEVEYFTSAMHDILALLRD
ncbi:MAG: Cysteine desulfurase CsdA [Candidatus Erwinia impunctatus]|nr:Cysteine desulfurase CsdA [Culicoides impunctatus]